MNAFLSALSVITQDEVELSLYTHHAIMCGHSFIKESDIEDWTQKCLLECMDALKENSTLSDESIRRSIWRVSKQFYRTKCHHHLDIDPVAVDSGTNDFEIADLVEWATRLLRDTASDFDTLVLNLTIEGYTSIDISKRLGVSLSSITRSTRRIRETLSEIRTWLM